MKKLILTITIFSLIFIAACTQDPAACTKEAKICPDGSSVGRTGPNCEFAPCPNASIANPASVFCEENNGTLIIVNEDSGQKGVCVLPDGTRCEEWAYFRGECGQKFCTQDVKTCPDGSSVGRDPSNNCQFYSCPVLPGNGTECTEPRPEACTMQYDPVCGYFNQSIQCFRYPCAALYGNACTACADPKVAYYEKGECPN